VNSIESAIEAITVADALLITAGAGMGVDSGLPDFRGVEGFWRAYPPLARLGISFEEMANSGWLEKQADLAWGFYGHRLNLYRQTIPHRGFKLLLEAAGRLSDGAFVVTSNVDGQFQKAGFDPKRIWEIHGSIHRLQCADPCGPQLWAADSLQVSVDPATLLANFPLPTCPRCGGLARPNILMFGDRAWLSDASDDQESAFESWLGNLHDKRLVIIECGAGTAIPSIRWISNHVAQKHRAPLIRINPREAQVLPGQFSIPTGAQKGISLLFPSSSSYPAEGSESDSDAQRGHRTRRLKDFPA
jgi:NAD-dependent SIR2 family protein deacetylase